MPTKTASEKVECLNPNTAGRMNIDKKIYDLFSKAIYPTLKKNQPLTYTEIVEGIHDCFKQQKTKFDGSVGWCAVTVKHGMHVRGVIEVFTEKNKKCTGFRNKEDFFRFVPQSIYP